MHEFSHKMKHILSLVQDYQEKVGSKSECCFVVGLLSSSGTHWKQTRTFTITALREFGFGKKSLEGRIREEVEVFLDVISDYGGPFDVSYDVHVSISNIICSIVFGRRFERNDKDFRWLLDQIDLKKSSPTSLVTTFPVLRFLPGDPFGIKSFFKKFQDVLDYFRSSVEKHRHTFDPNSPRDFIDAFIQEKGKHEEDNLVFRGTVGLMLMTLN